MGSSLGSQEAESPPSNRLIKINYTSRSIRTKTESNLLIRNGGKRSDLNRTKRREADLPASRLLSTGTAKKFSQQKRQSHQRGRILDTEGQSYNRNAPLGRRELIKAETIGRFKKTKKGAEKGGGDTPY